MRKSFSPVVAGVIAALIAALPLLPQRDSRAGVLCSLPFTLTNGTTADATQVMANYNAIITCLANAAAAGANNDITALNGLTTPLPPNEGGTAYYIGSGVTGANTIAVSTTTPTGFSLAIGRKVVFTAATANTGATTLNVAGLGATNFFRLTPSGAAQMVGGEITGGQMVEATFDGVQFQMTSAPALGGPPGAVFDYAGAAGCPAGSAAALGGSLATASFPLLSSILGTSWGSPGGGNFSLPDLRGRATFGIDNGQNRITVAGGNFDGTVFANTGGGQNHVLTQAELPNYTLPTGTAAAQSISCNSTSCRGVDNGQGGLPATASGGSSFFNTGQFTTISAAASNVTITSGGSGTAHTVLSPAAIVLKCVKE